MAEYLAADRQGATPWAAIAGIIATVAVFAIAQGLTYPLLSLILKEQGASSSLIGLSAAMTPLGLITSSPFIPKLARRFGPGRTVLCCAGLGLVLLFGIGWMHDVRWWFPLRYLLGVAVNPLYVISESWMIALAPPDRRGRVMGVYTAIIAGGFAAGPLCLTLVGTAGWPPFLVGMSAFVVCIVCLVAVLPRLPSIHQGDDKPSVIGFFGTAPLLLFAVACAAGFEQTMLSLFAVYGQAYGAASETVAAMLAVFIAGNIVLQFPLGLLAEKLGVKRVVVGCALASALGCLALPFVFGGPLLWPLVFVWGAVSYGIYTMSLIELGERFSGALLVAGNAAFSMIWGVGGIAGPPVTGAVMDWVGIQGLPLTLGAMWLMLAAVRSSLRR